MSQLQRGIAAAVLLSAFGCTAKQDIANDPPPAAMRPVDSTHAADRASFDSAVRQMRDSAPSMVDSLRRYASFAAHLTLARFGYIGGPINAAETPALNDAIRRYQRARGLAVNGDPLDRMLWETLQQDARAIDEPISVETRAVWSDERSAIAKGAWRSIPPQRAGNQVFAVDIFCTRAAAECRESLASLSRFGDRQTLTANSELWRIDRWDRDEIVASVRYPCTSWSLRINLVLKQATKVRSTISRAEMCEMIDTRDWVQELVGATEVGSEAASSRLATQDSVLVMTQSTRQLFRALQRTR